MASIDEIFKPYTTFDRSKAETDGSGKVNCLCIYAVDKTGKVIYHHLSGETTLDPNAQPIEKDALFKVASCTKLITTIAALQCVERGLITLDEPVYGVLPELSALLVASGEGFEKQKKTITLRTLLTHTSGLVYFQLAPPAIQAAAGNVDRLETHPIPEAFSTPLMFEPGDGWMYSPSLDWTGLLVKRITGGSLENYFNKNIWSRVGLQAPYPTFDINLQPERKAKLLQVTERMPTGGLKSTVYAPGESPPDECGGHGLVTDIPSYVAVLADIVSESPKLLKPETLKLMFEPQLKPNSPSTQGLNALRFIYDVQTGSDPEVEVNFGLGGLLLMSKSKTVGTPKNTLLWGGITNHLWFANRDKGLAGMCSMHELPPGEPVVAEIVNKFQKDFWSKFGDD